MTDQPRRPHFIRVNLDDPETLHRLIRNGAIWRLPPFWQMAVNAIERGDVAITECENVPPEVRDFLTPSR